eukprot:1376223-Amphidinium_carterae.1
MPRFTLLGFYAVFDLMDSMHPRFQPPPEGEREVPDEAKKPLRASLTPMKARLLELVGEE